MHSRSIRRLVLSATVAAAAAMFVPQAADVTIAQTASGRSIVVLSDLHMGIGKDASGAWKVWDVVIEGISYVKSFREDFGLEIERKGLEGLLQRLEASAKPEGKA